MSETTLKNGLIMRPAVMDDAPTVLALLHEVSMRLVGEIEDTLDDVQGEWSTPHFSLERNTRLVFDPAGRLVGYGVIYDLVNPDAPFIDVYNHPDLWGSDDVIEPALFAWVEGRVLENADKVNPDTRLAMRGFAHTTDERYRASLEKAGLEPIRHSFRMVIDLDAPPDVPPLPEGITLRVVQEGDDWRPILEAIRDIWRDHWGYVERPFEVHYERWHHQWEKYYRPGWWLLAMDGDTIAGICLNEDNFNDDETWGWVSTLGVKRQYRRQGLAMAMLKRAFALFYETGRRHAGLGVDASSLTGATKLYEAAGMRVGMSYTMHEKILRPGFDPSTSELDEQQAS